MRRKTELLESQHPLGELKLRLQRVPPAIERYRLKVTVMEAEGVLAMDRSGTSDPYVEINVANQVQKTSIQKKTLAPVWRESFVFNVNSWAHGTRAFCKVNLCFTDDLTRVLSFLSDLGLGSRRRRRLYG